MTEDRQKFNGDWASRPGRSLGTPPLPDAVRIELNRLNRTLVRTAKQTVCDEIEAKIQAIEAEYYTKVKSAPKRTEKPKPADKPPAKKRTGKSATKPSTEKPPIKKRKKHEPLLDHPLIQLGAD